MTDGYDETLAADGPPPAVSAAGAGPTSRLEVGAVFADRYEVQGLLGAGGMGAVYRVRDRKLDETVALKVLTLGSTVAVERFRSEVRLARRVTHPNVARTHDLGEHERVRFLTMEYVRGEPLDRLLARATRLEEPRAMEIAAEIADGLAAAHDAGVVHRDLKPANVLLAEDGRVVLTDFGIARALGPAPSRHRTAGIVGTPHYMSPEQVAGRPVDARSDVYALGLILFELVTGTVPFEGETPIAAAVARLSQPAPDPRDHAPVSPGLAALILRCLSRDPELRPQRAAEVAAALRAPDQLAGGPARGGEEPSLFAPIALGSRTLAVLPFAFRGPTEHDYLGDGLAEELIDVLSRTRGLRVLALGATRRFAEARDPSAVCAELSATAVVDGTLQVAGPKVRLSARLLQPDGVQTWSERFDGPFEDVFALQESMGQRVAEALRLELESRAYGERVPRRAVDLYLQARRDLRSDIATAAEGAVTKLDEVLELAPDFGPAIAYHATAAVRAWWGTGRDTGRDTDGARGERAKRSVARAKERAPDLAETHLAIAMLAVQATDFPTAANALAEALEIAPTLYEAHEYLGRLQLEAGRPEEGRRRLELALELHPDSPQCHLVLSRSALLRGDLARFRAHRAELERLYQTTTFPLLVARVRWALYQGDEDGLRTAVTALGEIATEPSRHMHALFAPLLDLEKLPAALAIPEQIPEWLQNARFSAFLWQIATETFSVLGELDTAFEMLGRCASGGTIDIEWVRLCPALAPMRSDSRFAPLEVAIEKRAADVWRKAR